MVPGNRTIQSRYDPGGRRVLDVRSSVRLSLPSTTKETQADSGGSGAGTNNPLALIGSSIAGLGAGPFSDGQLAVIRVGVWPDTEYVELVWDDVAGMWISKPADLVSQADQTYMGVNTTAWSYISTSNSGTTPAGIAITVKPIRHAAALFAAGLSLQAALSGVVSGTALPSSVDVNAFFFQHNDGEAVVFSSDGSTAVGWLGTPNASDASSALEFRSTGWQYVLRNGLSGNPNKLTSVDIVKNNLWPRIYGKVSNGSSYGSLIDTDLQYRWVA